LGELKWINNLLFVGPNYHLGFKQSIVDLISFYSNGGCL